MRQNLLLQKTLRLWVVCRFIESRWRCWTDKDDEDITEQFPDDPFYDWVSPPPYVDYQFASVIINRILLPLREDILRDLEKMVEKHKPEDWYVTFLISFILLQNYELQMRFQRDFAQRRQWPVSNFLHFFCANLPVAESNGQPGAIYGHASGPRYELGREDYTSTFPLLLQRKPAFWREV